MMMELIFLFPHILSFSKRSTAAAAASAVSAAWMNDKESKREIVWNIKKSTPKKLYVQFIAHSFAFPISIVVLRGQNTSFCCTRTMSSHVYINKETILSKANHSNDKQQTKKRAKRAEWEKEREKNEEAQQWWLLQLYHYAIWWISI